MFQATIDFLFLALTFLYFTLQEAKRNVQQFATALKLASAGRLILSSRERACSTCYLSGAPKELHSS
jgi:hypothetical protein